MLGLKYLKLFEDIDYEKDFDWEEEDPSEPVKIKNASELKIGDRVMCDNVGGYQAKDAIGTVISWDLGESGVEFDDYIDGHACDYNGKDGHCWYVNVNYIYNIRKI